jgi:AcrR family transcriptional regulator
METKPHAIMIGDQLMCEQGYNATTFKDIAAVLKVTSASLHYHFPERADLCHGVIQHNRTRFNAMVAKSAKKKPSDKIKDFTSMYIDLVKNGKISLLSVFTAEYNTLDENVKEDFKLYANEILEWLMAVLEDGQKQQTFRFRSSVRLKALQILSLLSGIEKLCRVTDISDSYLVQTDILHDLMIDQ